MSYNQFDFILVGQGIAGTMLAHELIKRKQKILVIDQGIVGTSSAIAGGIINPVTGKRIVKSWKTDELIPAAVETYKELEALLGAKLFEEITICRYFVNAEDPGITEEQESADWYPRYVKELTHTHAGINNSLGGIELTPSYRIYPTPLLQGFRELLRANDSLLEETFVHKDLQFEPEGIKYKNNIAKQVVFCEGRASTSNPWFGNLPYNLSKGELLIVKIDGLVPDRLFIPSKGVYFIPLEDNLYYVGSTSDWRFDDDQPSEEKKALLLQKMTKALNLEYTVVDHLAAVRPSVRDRRPLLGAHAEHKQLVIFNGMGTKGYSLSPYYAKQMVEYLVFGQAIDSEVNIDRSKN